jgi:NitT/TauT family transport system substrate-binding protein
MKQFSRALAIVAVAAFTATGASANQSISLMLNWVPGADHAPIFYALDAGHYSKAGITLNVQNGKGSAMAAQVVGVGSSQMGISEVGTAFLANGKGADLVAVMAIYANSPFVLYWKKSSGISGPKDFVGRTLGNPPGDAARAMWPAFAAAASLPPDAVKFVNVSPQAKVPTLAAGRVDMISDFYNGHDLKIREFGDDLGYIPWRRTATRWRSSLRSPSGLMPTASATPIRASAPCCAMQAAWRSARCAINGTG